MFPVEECKIILKFRKEDEQISLSPITLLRELKRHGNGLGTEERELIDM